MTVEWVWTAFVGVILVVVVVWMAFGVVLMCRAWRGK